MDKPKIEKVFKLGLKKERNYLYFIDKEGDVARISANREGRTKQA